MHKALILLLLPFLSFSQVKIKDGIYIPAINDSIMLSSIFKFEMSKGRAYKDLEYLSKNIGHRISGSVQAEKAVEWTFKLMKEYGFDTVYLQQCMVPKWVRGKKEQCVMFSRKLKDQQALNVLALGGCIGTGDKGVLAGVVEIKSWEELKEKGEKGELKGKIVFYNRPFDVTLVSTFSAYGKAVDQRYAGAPRASKYGAIGMIVRSMTTALDDYPHTGGMAYNDSFPKIPGVAISTKDAEFLSKQLKNDPLLQISLKTWCQTLPDAVSYNVIGELRGSMYPGEIITVGGHLDSWDVGEGSHDDGAGCIQSIEVLRIFKELGIKPKRTVRAVMFMNEENGGRGGDKYYEVAKQKNEKHIAAIESDRGAFTPRGFTWDTTDTRVEKFLKWKPLFTPYMADRFEAGGSGADISDLKKIGAFTIGYYPDPQRYFDLHHTAADTFDKINRRELEMGAAVMAMLTWLISEYGL